MEEVVVNGNLRSTNDSRSIAVQIKQTLTGRNSWWEVLLKQLEYKNQ